MALPNDAPGIIDGNYTAVIQAGPHGGTGTIASTSLEQTGTIPLGDNSLLFRAWAGQSTPASAWFVSFAGNTLPLTVLASTPQYTLYGADISAYSGDTGLLAFTANAQFAPSFLELDDITFSASSAPEPSPAILAALGGFIFATFHRKTPSR